MIDNLLRFTIFSKGYPLFLVLRLNNNSKFYNSKQFLPKSLYIYPFAGKYANIFAIPGKLERLQEISSRIAARSLFLFI
jgi:hypothetical protein